MTSANEKQVGGDHYKRGGSAQHWDVIDDNNIGYLEGNATKYVSRWRHKGGIQDLEKAAHYVEKLIEKAEQGRRPRGIVTQQTLADFCNEYDLGVVEASICTCLLRWTEMGSLQTALRDIRGLIDVERRVGDGAEHKA